MDTRLIWAPRDFRQQWRRECGDSAGKCLLPRCFCALFLLLLAALPFPFLGQAIWKLPVLLVRDFVSCLLKRSPAPPSLPERSKRLPIFSCQKNSCGFGHWGVVASGCGGRLFPLLVAVFFKRRCDARLLLSAALGRDRGGDFSVVLGNFLDPMLMAISSFSFDGAADFVPEICPFFTAAA